MRHSTALLAAGAMAVVGLVPANPAVAAKPTHVAIVIAGHGVGCVRWHSGITGDDVLNAVATVKYRPTDGLITQIDGQPKNNRADETHYWSYWHNTGSGWVYSTGGASAYHPKAGSVEGWHFINGSPTATPPRLRSYSSICHDTVVAAPPPTSPTPTHSTSHPATTSPASTVRTSTAAVSTSPSHATLTNTTSRSHSSAAPTSSAATPATSSTSESATAAAAGNLPTLHVRNTADDAKQADQGSALPTVLVVAMVLVLGGVAAFVAQRRRQRT